MTKSKLFAYKYGNGRELFIAEGVDNSFNINAELYPGLVEMEPEVVAGTLTDTIKEVLGLDAVDNTADMDKPISTAVLAALNSKVDKSTLSQSIQDGIASAGGAGGGSGVELGLPSVTYTNIKPSICDADALQAFVSEHCYDYNENQDLLASPSSIISNGFLLKANTLYGMHPSSVIDNGNNQKMIQDMNIEIISLGTMSLQEGNMYFYATGQALTFQQERRRDVTVEIEFDYRAATSSTISLYAVNYAYADGMISFPVEVSGSNEVRRYSLILRLAEIPAGTIEIYLDTSADMEISHIQLKLIKEVGSCVTDYSITDLAGTSYEYLSSSGETNLIKTGAGWLPVPIQTLSGNAVSDALTTNPLLLASDLTWRRAGHTSVSEWLGYAPKRNEAHEWIHREELLSITNIDRYTSDSIVRGLHTYHLEVPETLTSAVLNIHFYCNLSHSIFRYMDTPTDTFRIILTPAEGSSRDSTLYISHGIDANLIKDHTEIAFHSYTKVIIIEFTKVVPAVLAGDAFYGELPDVVSQPKYACSYEHFGREPV